MTAEYFKKLLFEYVLFITPGLKWMGCNQINEVSLYSSSSDPKVTPVFTTCTTLKLATLQTNQTAAV